jgi:hypothetical protein
MNRQKPEGHHTGRLIFLAKGDYFVSIICKYDSFTLESFLRP